MTLCVGQTKSSEAYALYKEILSHESQEIYNKLSFLQSLVDSQEASLTNPQGTKPHSNVVEADETYMEATFPTSSNKHPIEQKVLGVRWNVSFDRLVFSLEAMLKATTTAELTKRVVISPIG